MSTQISQRPPRRARPHVLLSRLPAMELDSDRARVVDVVTIAYRRLVYVALLRSGCRRSGPGQPGARRSRVHRSQDAGSASARWQCAHARTAAADATGARAVPPPVRARLRGHGRGWACCRSAALAERNLSQVREPARGRGWQNAKRPLVGDPARRPQCCVRRPMSSPRRGRCPAPLRAAGQQRRRLRPRPSPNSASVGRPSL